MTQERHNQDSQPPDDLIQMYLGLLTKGPSWSPDSSPEVKNNQKAHLALLSQLSREGKLLLAGPTPSHHDLRGILIIKAQNEEEAHALFQDDPHLQSDRLRLDIHPIFLSKANLTKPLLPSFE